MTIPRKLLLYLVVAAFVAACGESSEPGQQLQAAEPGVGEAFAVYGDTHDGDRADHLAMYSLVIADADDAARVFTEEGRAVFEYPDAFRQVGLRLQADSVDALAFRGRLADESWSDWEPVDVYWSEGSLHNGLILLDEPATAIELRGAEAIEFAALEFFPQIIARSELIRSDEATMPADLPHGPDDLRTAQQASVAPASLVTSRASWGATSPNQICGSVVTPYRMAIHHTAVPASDGNLYATMRGMQNYHMNNNEWCDIGYHFVVAQSGEILQGRSRADRPGAHVGGQNSGNVGISLIGNYVSANPPQVQVNSAGAMVRWVHETYNIPLNRSAIKGHREHAGQWTSCPGDRGIAHIDEIISIANRGGSVPGPSANYGADLSIHVHGLDDFYTQGTSASVADAFAEESFTAEIRLKNTSDQPIRGVKLAYAFDQAGIVAENYRIETDHPAYNQSSWVINDANDAPENPAGAQMGTSGTLTMHAFSPNETKRVFIDLKTTGYNIGVGDFSGLRAWVANIDGVYAQSSFDADPSQNVLGGLLRAHARVDVLSRSEWQFQAGQPDDLEGWTGEGPQESLKLNTSHDLLAQQVTDVGATLIAPSWTSIDADRFDELVLRARSHDGEHQKVIYFAGAGEDFDATRSLRFQATGDGEFHTYVVALSEHPEWAGLIDGIRLGLNEDLGITEESSAWYDVDHIYFQNRVEGITSSTSLGVVEQAPVQAELGDAGGTPGEGPEGPGTDTERNGEHGADSSEVKVNTGCAVVGSSGQRPDLALFLVAAMTFFTLRRRRASRDERRG